MTLVKFNPAVRRNKFPVSPFFNMFNDIIGSDFVNNAPSVNVIESAEDFRIELAAPGLDKGDFNIKVEKDQLTISAKKESSSDEQKEKFTRREFNYSSFSRTFFIPEGVNTSTIGANYENGVLVVTLPKKEEAKEKAPFSIEVK